MNKTFFYILMLLAACATSVQNVHASLQKNETGAYVIATAQDLVDFASLVNKGETGASALLTADIDLSGVTFSPIGNAEGTRYQGLFDGAGYVIDNLVISAAGESGVGLFGYVESATIQDVILGPGCRVEGKSFVGGFVGDKVQSGTATLRSCGFEGTVVCSAQNGAAFVGCVHSGSVVMDHCYNTGTVRGGRESAIFCGWFSGASSSISNSYNAGTLASGVDGSNYLWRSSPAVTRVFDSQGRQSTTRFSQADLKSGALTWKLNGNTAQGAFRQNLEGEAPDTHPTTSQHHACVYACGELQCDGSPVPGTTATYANEGHATYLPHHFAEGFCAVCQRVDDEYLYPDAHGYYLLETPQALRWFAAYVNADPARAGFCARLTADLNMKGVAFEGIGTTNAPYTGEFDGGKHSITYLVMNRSGETNVGFVNVAHTSSWIHDLTLGTGCAITGGRYVGGFIGKVDGTNGDRIRVARLGFEGTVTVNNNGGAIIGCIPNNDIKAYFLTCYSTGTINGTTECGALSGWASYAQLTNCYARVRSAGFETDHDVVRGFTPVFHNCYAYGAKQKADGLGTFTLTELKNGVLLEKLADPAYHQVINTDANPKLTQQ